MDLQLDFHSDWIAQLHPELTRMGYTVPTGTDAREVALLYFNALFRRIPQKQLKIWKSREMQCPPQFQNGLNLLEQKVASGGDLNPHLSRQSVKLDYDDALLNDWGIFHFHLGTTVIASGKKKGLIEGTDPVLFARVTESGFYEICMGSHHNGWADLNWIEILHKNWPKSIEQFKQPPTTALTHVVDRATVEALRAGQGRKAGKINAPIQTQDGTIYSQFGGGYTRDGRSILVAMTVNQRVGELRRWEKLVRSNTGMFLDDLKRRGYKESTPLKGELTVDADGWYVLFPNWKYRIQLKPTSGRQL